MTVYSHNWMFSEMIDFVWEEQTVPKHQICIYKKKNVKHLYRKLINLFADTMNESNNRTLYMMNLLT